MVSDIDALVKSSQEAFDQLDEETLKSVFLTKKLILREIIRSRGNNDFKLPHKAKSTVKSKESKKSSKLGVVSVFQNPATIFSGQSSIPLPQKNPWHLILKFSLAVFPNY